MAIFEDMDTSESEKSEQGIEEEDDDDDEWVIDLEKPAPKKRNSKPRSQESTQNMEGSGEDGAAKPVSAVPCCSCSKFSSCKTSKCQCRATNGMCGASCGCAASKCANRGEVIEIMADEDSAESLAMASHGAMLLESALEEKRKPLSNIGNTAVLCFFFTLILIPLKSPLLA